MASGDTYKQYIYKNGEFRKVSAGISVPPSESETSFSDIQIKSIMFKNYDEDNSKNSSDLFNLMSSSNNPENIKICFETSPIDDKFEAAITAGKAIIRLDYPIPHKGSRITKSGCGHKGFSRNLYKQNAENLGEYCRYKDEILRSFIFISSSDIKTNEYGEKYIYKELGIVELANKISNVYVQVVVPGGLNYAFEKAFDNTAIENFDFIFPHSVTDRYDGQRQDFGESGPSTAYYDFTSRHGFWFGENSNRKLVKHNVNYRVLFPLFIKLTFPAVSESFEWFLERDNGRFGINNHLFCPDTRAKRNKLSGDYNISDRSRTSVGSLINCYNRVSPNKKRKKRSFHTCFARPRLAILKDDYLTIGSTSSTQNSSMWKKTFSQSEQMIRFAFNGVYYNNDGYTTSGSNTDLIFSCTAQLTKEK